MANFFVQLLTAFFSLFRKAKRPKIEEGAGEGDIEQALKQKIKKEGWG